MEFVIRENIPAYLAELRDWLSQTKDVRLEEMGGFFTQRLAGYEEHMSPWRDAYRRMAELLPADCWKLLDLGCGTGLELDEIFARLPDIQVTGVDLCAPMLEKLREKHAGRALTLRCEDYFRADLGRDAFDGAVSFESLHHFTQEKKEGLFLKIHEALRPGGFFLEADYIACCGEEEAMLFEECARRRARDGVGPDAFIHFDTPLTLEHETAALRSAGFAQVTALESIEGATFIRAIKR